MDIALMDSRQRLINIARSFVGVKEEGGNNKGELVELFQKAVDGKAHGEPWCLAFVWFCIKQAELSEGESPLFQTEHCLTMWNKSPKEQRVFEPVPGDLIIWQHYKRNKATQAGHVGIITEKLSAHVFKVVEGNTGPGNGIVREGDGVFEKTRNIKYHYGSMRVLGFLRVW